MTGLSISTSKKTVKPYETFIIDKGYIEVEIDNPVITFKRQQKKKETNSSSSSM